MGGLTDRAAVDVAYCYARAASEFAVGALPGGRVHLTLAACWVCEGSTFALIASGELTPDEGEAKLREMREARRNLEDIAYPTDGANEKRRPSRCSKCVDDQEVP